MAGAGSACGVPGAFCTMRLGSGAFAAICVAIEVIGVALFIRGFFPAPVRSSARPEQRAETPAPEPVAGMDPLPGGLRFHAAPPPKQFVLFSVVSVSRNFEAIAATGPVSTFLSGNQSKPRVTLASPLILCCKVASIPFPNKITLNFVSQFRSVGFNR